MKPLHRMLACLSLSWSGISLHAQPAAPGVGPQPADETLVLSPFVIMTERDTGYIAADTLSSGRLSTNLLMTPSDTSVLTRDLLNDLAVFNIDEAMGWLANSRPLELGAIEGNSVNAATMDVRDNGSNVSLRGLTTQPSTRNYFPSATTPMEYNVERVEGARGPNAILYGEGGPGGTVNYLTKRARMQNFTTVRVRADDWGSINGQLDLNRKLGRKLALRYNGSWMEGRNWQDRVKNNHVASALAVTVEPVEKLSLNFEVDGSRTYRSGMISSYLDGTSNWNRQPIGNPATEIPSAAAATARGLTILGSGQARFLAYAEGLGVVDWRGWGRTTGTNMTIIPTAPRTAYVPFEPPVRSKSFYTNPSDVNVKGRTLDAQASVQKQFGRDLMLELAGAFGRIEQDGASVRYADAVTDPNRTLPNGQPNPNFGKLYSFATWGRNIDGSYREHAAVRAAGNYAFRMLGGVQNVSVIAQRLALDSRARLNNKYIVNNPSAALPIYNTANILNIFRYWDNLPRDLPDFAQSYEFRNVPEQDNLTERQTDSIQLGTYGSYLEDQLSIVGGIRREKSDIHTSNGNTAGRDPVTGAMTGFALADRLAYRTSLSGGIVYFPLKFIGVYANYSEGFTVQTNSNPRIDGSFANVNIVPSKVKTAGLRFRGFGGKLIGSAGYYRSKEESSFRTNGVGNFNTLWRNHNLLERVIPTFTAAENVTDTQSFEGWGWEGEVTANVSNALRFTGNLSFPRTRQSEVSADYVAYAARNMAEFQRLRDLPTNAPAITTSDTLQINNILNILGGFAEGREQNQTYKWRLNLFGNYTVQESALKGLRIGLGGQVFGPRLIGNELNLPFNYIYDKRYYLLSGSLGYAFKVRHTRVDLQLNAVNLLNHDDPLFNGVFNYNGAIVPYGYKYAAERSWRLTATVRF